MTELRVLREQGLLRLHRRPYPELAGAADSLGLPVDVLLERVVARLDGDLAHATAYTLGTAPGTRDWPASERRKHAAKVYRLSVERFRKEQELLILENVAARIRAMLGAARPAELPMGSSLRLQVGGAALTLHRRPVETLKDVAAIASSENVYLEMSKSFKSSLSASLRAAAAARDDVGDVVDDVLPRELRAWMRAHGREGGRVTAGTVVPTSPGELRRHGVRRLYHAAIAVPLPGSNDYSVEPAAVDRAVHGIFRLAAHEGMASVCLPMFGAGRAGLDPETAFAYLWGALAHEAPWACELHIVTRSERGTNAALRGLRAAGAVPAS
ncbi:hypothetical protein Skr01_15430 [Sphaerisporangium krabiense]|nr:hypothetical protein Skr01_15430 [Sphaerisporangium krabiense]